MKKVIFIKNKIKCNCWVYSVIKVFTLFAIIFLFACCSQKKYTFYDKPELQKDGSVLFGDWPQTVKNPEVKVNEAQCIIRGSLVMYPGSDGFYYCKKTATPYSKSYSYSNGSPVVSDDGSCEAYFKVEPVRWIVMEQNADGNSVLVCSLVIDGGVPFYSSSHVREILMENSCDQNAGDSDKIFPNNYEWSTLRSYLNSGENSFIDSAFSVEAKKNLVDCEIDNSGISKYDCNSTKDKVWLLSKKEVEARRDLGVCVATDYAKACGVYTDSDNRAYWWLRSPSIIDFCDTGYCNCNGNPLCVDFVYHLFHGIRPVVCVVLCCNMNCPFSRYSEISFDFDLFYIKTVFYNLIRLKSNHF